MKWSPQQVDALKKVDKWIVDYYSSRKKTKQVFYLEG